MKFLSLLVLLPFSSLGAGLIGIPLSSAPTQLPVKVFTPVSATADSAPALQAMIDSLPQVHDVFSGVGGGKIVFAPGTYTFTTNVVLPNYFPWGLEMAGANAMGGTTFFLKNTHQNKSKGYFCVATNAINGMSLTNGLRLDVHGIAFVQEDMLSTNFIFEIKGQTWCHLWNNFFTTAYGLTNGQGAFSLNWEANVPNQPIGCCGVNADTEIWDGFGGSGANAQFFCDHNWFYCLANALVCGSVEMHVSHNYFSCIGMYNSTLPPIVNNSNCHMATNLWQGDIGGAPTPISSGATIIGFQASGLPVVEYNEFFGCGLCGWINVETRWIGNRYSLCGYRLAEDQDNYGQFLQGNVIDYMPTSGQNSISDVILTNNGAATIEQPNGGLIGIGPTPRRATVGSPLTQVFHAQSQGAQYIAFSGGSVWMTNGFAVGTGGGTWATNSTLPSSTSVIKAWLTVTNDSGKVGKVPVYY